MFGMPGELKEFSIELSSPYFRTPKTLMLHISHLKWSAPASVTNNVHLKATLRYKIEFWKFASHHSASTIMLLQCHTNSNFHFAAVIMKMYMFAKVFSFLQEGFT